MDEQRREALQRDFVEGVTPPDTKWPTATEVRTLLAKAAAMDKMQEVPDALSQSAEDAREVGDIEAAEALEYAADLVNEALGRDL